MARRVPTASRPVAGGRAGPIELLVLDVDGVLTDGSIYLDDRRNEIKRFHVRDGLGIKLWQNLGFKVVVITGRRGRALRHRAKELGVDWVVQGREDKWGALQRLLRRKRIAAERVACMVDDWTELVMMKNVGLSIAVADADALVVGRADWVTKRPGGRAAVREAIERLIRAKGLMDRAVALYDEPHAAR